MDTPQDTFNMNFASLIQEAASFDLQSEESSTAMKNLETFSKCQPQLVEEPELLPEPTTFWGKFKLTTSRLWDNETTRVFIKTGGTFAGIALVAHQTIKQDRVLERQALAQANQRNS